MNKCHREKNVLMLMHDVDKSFKNTMNRKSESTGVIDAFRPILMMLNFNNGCTQLEIVKWTHLKAPTISLTLQKMELCGLIERKENESDKRNINIFITEKGKDLDNKIRCLFKETEEEFLKDLSEEELDFMKKLLRKILNNAGYNEGDKK